MTRTTTARRSAPIATPPPHLQPHPRLLTEREVAALLGVSVRALQRWRNRNNGPRFMRLGGVSVGNVRYLREDVEAYLDARAATDNATATA